VAEARPNSGGNLFTQGLERHEHSLDGPISGLLPYSIYFDDGDQAVQFSCTPFVGPAVSQNPTCNGALWVRSQNLVLYMFFPSEVGQFQNESLWHGPVNATIALVTDWRI